MKVAKFLLISGVAFLATSCATTKTYSIIPKSGTETSGIVTFTQKGNEVTMVVNAYKLSAGEHAIHIHEKADCSAADGTSTGGHWNPGKNDHGKWGIGHFHMGDIGNLVAQTNGTATLTFKTDKWCIGCKDESKNILGKGLIIHASQDDFKTQPTGNAGGRIGCVEIK